MLKRSIVISGALHLGVIVAASVAWPHAIELSDETPPNVPVDLVTVADVTNVTPTTVEKKEEPQPEQPAPPPPPEATPPPPEAEVAPDFDKKPLPKPPPPKEAEETPPPPAKPALPRPKPQPEAPKFDVGNVLALLDKVAPKAEPPPPNAKPAEETRKGIGNQDALSLDIKDALLAQMRECWNVPAGAPNPEQLIVQLRVFLAPDGSLARPPEYEPGTRAAMASNRYMRTAAEAASRAINICAPYKRLPADRYDVWREIVMTFDPSKMIGR